MCRSHFAGTFDTSSFASFKIASLSFQLMASTSASWSISSRTCCQCRPLSLGVPPPRPHRWLEARRALGATVKRGARLPLWSPASDYRNGSPSLLIAEVKTAADHPLSLLDARPTQL